MNIANILTKTAGIAAACLVLYDSHKTGKMISQQNIKLGIAGRLPDQYIRSRRQEDMSTVTSNFRDKIFAERVNFDLPDKINGITGYVKGAFEQLAYNIVPALLATGALVKNRFSKACGIGLGVYGIYYALSNILDTGKIRHFK